MKIKLVTMGRFHTYHQQILLHGPEEVTYEANISTGLYANPLYSYFRRLYRSKLLRRILGKNFNMISDIAIRSHNFYEKRQIKKSSHDLVHVCVNLWSLVGVFPEIFHSSSANSNRYFRCWKVFSPQ